MIADLIGSAAIVVDPSATLDQLLVVADGLHADLITALEEIDNEGE